MGDPEGGAGGYAKPFVVGAIIDLGNCLNLLERESIGLLGLGYENLMRRHEQTGAEMPRNRDPLGTLRYAWANFRDESFVLQFLSPHLIRKLKLFLVHNDMDEPDLMVDSIHNERGYRRIRQALARQYDIAHLEPDIQVTDVDLAGDRKLILEHKVNNGITLEERDAKAVLRHLANLWGYEVKLVEVDGQTDEPLKEHVTVGQTFAFS